MRDTKGLRVLRWGFWALVATSVWFIYLIYGNYMGMLASMDQVVYSIDSVYHHVDESRIVFTMEFSILNPTAYDNLDFNSLQCQVYLLVDGDEVYLGASGYGPPVDIPLKPGEPRGYSTSLTVPVSRLADGVVPGLLDLRVRNVVYYSTPLRQYYQIVYLVVESRLV